MTSMNLFPGINNISIDNFNQTDDEISLIQGNDSKIKLNFTLTGMNNLIMPTTSDQHTFYIYIFLAYQNGGKDFEIISSVEFHCDEEYNKFSSLSLESELIIPHEKIYTEDFLFNYYYLNIAYSAERVEDGSDINMLVNNIGSSLFFTKLFFQKEVKKNE